MLWSKGRNKTITTILPNKYNPEFSSISAAAIQRISIPSAATYRPFTCPKNLTNKEDCVVR
jgi:hypothetical protein